jgi:cytochrome P450
MNTATAQATRQALAELVDPASRPDPYPTYARIQAAGPTWLADMGVLVVAGYRDCEALLRDPRLSAQRGRGEWDALADAAPGDVPSSVRRPWFIALDAPDHTRLRRLVSKAFTARTVARLEQYITELTDDLIDAAADEDQWDVVAGLAYPLPITVICRLLGVPLTDEPLFHRWSAQLSRVFDGFARRPADGEIPDWFTAMVDIHRYFAELIRSKRDNPDEDLISQLLAAEHDGDVLTTDELVSTVVLLLVAGHETTVNLIANGVLAMMRHQYTESLRSDPGLVPSLVEETLRYDPPVQLTARVAVDDIEICGVPLPKGASVYLLLAAAQRDPGEFAEPDRFDPGRADAKHLAFGLGPHYCLGAPLARLEARVALSHFTERIVRPTLAQDPPPYREHVNLRGPLALPVRHSGLRDRQR